MVSNSRSSLYSISNIQDYNSNEDNSVNDENITQVTIKKVEKIKLQPKLHIGFGNFNFKGDISDNRNTGIIGQSGFQIGLSANLSEYINASILMEEGVVRVDGINRDDLPKFYEHYKYHWNKV